MSIDLALVYDGEVDGIVGFNIYSTVKRIGIVVGITHIVKTMNGDVVDILVITLNRKVVNCILTHKHLELGLVVRP